MNRESQLNHFFEYMFLALFFMFSLKTMKTIFFNPRLGGLKKTYILRSLLRFQCAAGFKGVIGILQGLEIKSSLL